MAVDPLEPVSKLVGIFAQEIGTGAVVRPGNGSTIEIWGTTPQDTAALLDKLYEAGIALYDGARRMDRSEFRGGNIEFDAQVLFHPPVLDQITEMVTNQAALESARADSAVIEDAIAQRVAEINQR